MMRILTFLLLLTMLWVPQASADVGPPGNGEQPVRVVLSIFFA